MMPNVKQLKREARIAINEITDKHCNSCNKHIELGYTGGIGETKFSREYCNVKCPAGRDLKKLGEILDKPREAKKMKVTMEPTKENYLKLKEDGLIDKLIWETFNIDRNRLYKLKKEWGVIGKPGKPRKVQEAAPVITVETIDHTEKLESQKKYIKQLEEKVEELSDQVAYLKQAEPFNRETYEELHKSRETVTDLSKMVTLATDEYRALQVKYDALKEYAKVIM